MKEYPVPQFCVECEGEFVSREPLFAGEEPFDSEYASKGCCATVYHWYWSPWASRNTGPLKMNARGRWAHEDQTEMETNVFGVDWYASGPGPRPRLSRRDFSPADADAKFRSGEWIALPKREPK